MSLFGLTFMRLMSSHAQRRIFTNKFYLRITQKAFFTVFSLSQDRSKQTYQFVRYKPNHDLKNSDIPYIHKSSHVMLSDKSQPDGAYHYTIVWLAGKFFAKLAAMIIGRSMNRTYRSLSPANRQMLLNNLQEYNYIPCAISGILFTMAWLYYFSHFEEAPVTKRGRFVSFSPEEAAELDQILVDIVIDDYNFISGEDARVRRAVNVATRIINSNPETNKIHKWKIYVINDTLANASVLSSGHIFIFEGILNLSSTDDQLAIVLGHEIAHAILSHGIETLSLSAFADWFLIVGFAVIWFVIGHDVLDVIATFLLDRIVTLLIMMPKSRRLEWEADHVGLILAANACYDVREAGILFRKVAKLQEKKRLPAWMETHPDSEKRADYLDSLLSDAEGWRKANGCPPLPKDKKGATTK